MCQFDTIEVVYSRTLRAGNRGSIPSRKNGILTWTIVFRAEQSNVWIAVHQPEISVEKFGVPKLLVSYLVKYLYAKVWLNCEHVIRACTFVQQAWCV